MVIPHQKFRETEHQIVVDAEKDTPLEVYVYCEFVERGAE